MAPETGRDGDVADLLFVHKSPTSFSLSHSQKEEKHLIASHVQNWRRKQKGTTASAQKVKSRYTLHSKQSILGEEAPPENGLVCLTSESKRATSLSQGFPTVNTRFLKRTHPSVSVASVSAQSIDPFNTSAIKLDEQTQMLLQYYIRIIYPSRFHTETRALSAEKHQFELAEHKLLRDCIANELQMITLLTSTASRLQYMEYMPLKESTDVYMHRALEALRRYVANSPVASTQLVFDMFNLFTAEAYRFNAVAAKIHLKAAKAIVEQMGGQTVLQRANPHLIETLVIGDLFIAAEELSAPVMECTFDPGFGTAKYLNLPSGSFRTQIGVRLLNPGQGAIISLKTYQIIKEIVECVKVAACTSEMQEPSSRALRWLHLRQLAIRHHLLSISLEDARNATLHIALQMWILIAFTRMGPIRTTKVMAPKLKASLEAIGGEDWTGHEDIYVWILSIGAIAARETPLESWYVQNMMELSRCGELSSKEALRHFSEQFFYLDSIQDLFLDRLSDQLSQARTRMSCSNGLG